MTCDLCERDVEKLTIHHLVPKQKLKRHGGPVTIISICSSCHRQIHSLYDNTTLLRELNSLEKLKNDPEMATFLSWIKKQDPSKRVHVRRKKDKI